MPFPELMGNEISGRGLYLPQRGFSLYFPLPVTGTWLKNMEKRICERQVVAQVPCAHGEPQVPMVSSKWPVLIQKEPEQRSRSRAAALNPQPPTQIPCRDLTEPLRAAARGALQWVWGRLWVWWHLPGCRERRRGATGWCRSLTKTSARPSSVLFPLLKQIYKGSKMSCSRA